MAANNKEIYEVIEDRINIEDNDTSRKPLLRQIVISCMTWISYFTAGITYGIPTVMLPQIRKYENSTITVSEDMEALLKSVYGYATIPWLFFFTYLTIVAGRRIPLIFVSIIMIIAYTLLYCSKSFRHILISEILQSCCFGATSCVFIILVCEYADPKYRGVMVTMKSAMCYWGIWISNAMGAFLPWRSIPILGIVCSLFGLPIIFFPESPSWLASKGKFEECRKAHRWLRGTSEDSEHELEKLIKSQEDYLSGKGSRSRTSLKEIVTMVKSGEFYKPLLLGVILCFMYNCSGKLVCVMYSIDIIKKITDSERMAYIGMLILDGITVLGMYIGSATSRYVSRRTMVFASSSATIIFLFTLSLYLYLIKLLIITENNFVSITLLSLYSIFVSWGIILMVFTLIGELVSLKYRSISMLTIAITNSLVYSVILQPTPYIFRYFGLHGAFCTYGVLFTIFTAICYKYLPETKDKSLVEIEEYFKDASERNVSNRDVNQILLSNTEVDKDVDK